MTMRGRRWERPRGEPIMGAVSEEYGSSEREVRIE